MLPARRHNKYLEDIEADLLAELVENSPGRQWERDIEELVAVKLRAMIASLKLPESEE